MHTHKVRTDYTYFLHAPIRVPRTNLRTSYHSAPHLACPCKNALAFIIYTPLSPRLPMLRRYPRNVFLLLTVLCALARCRGAEDGSSNSTDASSFSSSTGAVIHFCKHLFRELGAHQGDIAATLTPEMRAEYAQLSKAIAEGGGDSAPPLGTALAGVVELRIMDLEISLRHTRRLLEAVRQLGSSGGVVMI